MRTALTDDQWTEQFKIYERSAFRLELQPAYDVGLERDLFDKFVAGNPEPPTQEGFRAWYAKVAEQAKRGITLTRVRLVDEPPTDYQRWTRYMDRWNREAGERIHYLNRSVAAAVGLTEAFGGRDFWLFDDQRLALMKFDDQHQCVQRELSTNEVDLHQARSWRDLAITTARGDNE